MASVWNAALETNVEKIDKRHQEIFRQADVLADPSKHGKLTDMLKFLGEYVILHFQEEEDLQITSKYSEFENHKKFHTAFLASFQEMNQRYSNTGDKTVALDMAKLVTDWLKDHIMVHDKKFASYYRSTIKE
ncbi:MAG: hemerythrin family protein [Treponema sp.]|jgi:hemerythrin|nr:hemerythrin family protein [Treponema sp.]